MDKESLNESVAAAAAAALIKTEAAIKTEAVDSWYCTCCGIDMGINNPRQYCCKTYCPYMKK